MEGRKSECLGGDSHGTRKTEKQKTGADRFNQKCRTYDNAKRLKQPRHIIFAHHVRNGQFFCNRKFTPKCEHTEKRKHHNAESADLNK